MPVLTHSNLQPMFLPNEQLALSLRASTLWLPALRGSLIMDTERLQADIVSSLLVPPDCAGTPIQQCRPPVDYQS